MKKLFFALAAMGLFAACTPTPNGGNDGNGDNNGDDNTPGVTSHTFAIEVTATACKADVVVTPETGFTGYYYDNVVSAAKYAELGGTDNAFLAAYIEERTARFESLGYTWLDVVLDADQVDEWTAEGLDPETDYYVVAFGVDKNGNATTGLSKKAFTTGVAKGYDGWFGTFTASTPSSFNMYFDTGLNDFVQEVVNTPKSQPVYIQDAAALLEDPQYAGYAFVWNLTSSFWASTVEGGLAQWDSIYTVAEFNADGELQLMNGDVYTSYQDNAGENVEVTWASFCTITGSTAALNLVNGSYAAHTFAPAVDGVSTSVPYKGSLSGGGSFEVVVYDLFPIWESGQYSFYVEEDAPTYFFYGPITLTKTSDEVVVLEKPADPEEGTETTAVLSAKGKAKAKATLDKIIASKKNSKSVMQAKNRF